MLAFRLGVLATVMLLIVAVMTGFLHTRKHSTIPVVLDANGNVSNIKP